MNIDEKITKLKNLSEELRLLSLDILQDKELNDYKELYVNKLYDIPLLIKNLQDKIDNR